MMHRDYMVLSETRASLLLSNPAVYMFEMATVLLLYNHRGRNGRGIDALAACIHVRPPRQRK